MSGEATLPDDVALLVATKVSQSDSSLLRELVGDQECREKEMGDTSTELLEMLLVPRQSLGLVLLLYSFVEDTFTQERGSKKGYLLFFLYFSSCFDILVQYT